MLFGLLVGMATAFLYQRVIDRAEAEVERSALSYQRLIFNQLADLDRFVTRSATDLLIEQSIMPEQAIDRFRHRRATNPFIQDLLVLDANGSILATAWEGAMPDVDEHEYFTHHRDHPDSTLHVTRPQPSLVYENDWFISVSRALRNRDGELVGVAVGMFSVTSLTATLEALLSEEDLSIAVLTESGALILRLPIASRFSIGDDLTAISGVDLPLTAPATVHLRAGLDDIARIVHFRALPEYGLIVAASTSRSAVLAVWHLAVVLAIGIWLLFSVASLILVRRLRNSIRQAQASQARFRKVVESASDLIVLVNDGGVIQYASPNWKALLGYDPDEIIGQSSMDLIHPEDQPRLGKTLRAVVVNGETLSGIEYRVRHAEGHWRWHSASISALYDSNGGLDAVIGIVRDVTESQRHQRRLAQMAQEDPLTGLANRNHLSSLIDQALAEADRTGTLVAFLFIDLDHFKPVNDQHGHEVGDLILVQVARRIAGTLRRPDVAGRFGGDEFLVLLHDLSEPDQAIAIAKRIADRIGKAFAFDNQEISISCSIGVALYPDDGRDERELILRADQAMYQAKQNGRSTAQRYNSETVL